MRTSRIVLFAAAIAITASLIGATAFIATPTVSTSKAPEAPAADATTTLEPVVVVATR